MGTRVAAALIALALSSACVPWDTGSELETATIMGKSVTLVQSGGTCVLRAFGETQDVSLRVGTPCAFQRADGKPQIYEFPELGGTSVAVIVGTPISDSKRADYDLSETEPCFSNAQGITLTRRVVHVSDAIAENGLWCKNIGMDRRFFFGFAEDLSGARQSAQ
ncbi:hypothetical protein E1180_21380 [Roseibium denhamense]|uniref:hypothetical protein n=1 Tax=Roseibium denhamense TaxID=76305 RepID=UPI0012BD5D99|nr:hypothetical protein [Roseibium denhamense]MTI08057.1 hypothetical protein [Roseibium denhamense]